MKWFWKQRSEIAAELQAHIEERADELAESGVPRHDALQQARRELGNAALLTESSREVWGWMWLERLAQDFSYSLRMLRRSPGFTLVTVLTLAVGIGATTAIFSVIDAVLLKPLPIFDADRLVMLMTTGKTETGKSVSTSGAAPAEFEHWRAQTDAIQDVSAFLPGVMNYTGGDVIEQLRSMEASADLFRCWGITIVQGRTFAAEEELPDGPPVALLSEGVWTGRFAHDPQILGKTVALNGEPYSVIGIVADGPGLREFGSSPEVYVPFQFDPNTRDVGTYFKVVARLKPGLTLEQANARLQASVAEYRTRLPNSMGPDRSFRAVPFREAVAGDIRPLLLILLTTVSLVLLIACANVANLLLARATVRRREIGIRVAIGAGKGRMVRQLLTESMLLSLAGGMLGLFLGYQGIRALLLVNTADLPLIGQNGSAVHIDWRVLGFALLVSLGTGVVFGLFPALKAVRMDLNSVLKDNDGRSGGAARQNRTRAALVVSETSLTVILLVGSALLGRSFIALYSVDRGFETRNVVTMQTSLMGVKYSTSAGAAGTIRAGLDSLRSLPGVVAASAACGLPLQGSCAGLPLEIVGRPMDDDMNGRWSAVSPGFFEVFSIPVKRGRAFAARDDDKAPPVVVISERMAKEYWKDSDPLQDRIVIGRRLMKEFRDEPPRQIIGIAGDVRNDGLKADPPIMMYVPQAQLPDAESMLLLRHMPVAWIIRTNADPHGFEPALRRQVQQATGVPVSNILSMDEVERRSIGRQQFNLLLMTVFGGVALLLAAIGIYGLMAYTVEQRVHEIGIRLALGAEARQVRNMVVRQGMHLALTGIGIGLGSAWTLVHLMDALLFGVRAQDPIVFAIVPVTLSGVALLAVWLPAKRALRVDPVIALRHE